MAKSLESTICNKIHKYCEECVPSHIKCPIITEIRKWCKNEGYVRIKSKSMAKRLRSQIDNSKG